VRNALVDMMDSIVTKAYHYLMFPNGAKQTLGMLDAVVTFQDGADLEPTDNLLHRFLVLGTCTGRPIN